MSASTFAPARRSALLAAALGLLSLPAAAQSPGSASASAPASSEAVLRVDLGDGRILALTQAELTRLPAEAASATLRDRPPFQVHGVSVTTLLRLAGLDLEATLGSGPVVGKALVARAADGYAAVSASRMSTRTSAMRR